MSVGGLTAAQIASIQATQLAYLPDRCNVLRPPETPNAAGGTSYAYATVPGQSAVPCEAAARVLRQIIEHEAGARMESAVRWNVVMPLGTDIKLDDRLVITNGSTGSVMTLEANGLLTDESWPGAMVVECLRAE